METKEFKIQVPDGYEIDKDNSTFECIKFKLIDKKLTYDDVAKELFKGRNKYIHTFFTIDGWKESVCASDKQVEKLLAINKLMNVAKYFNMRSDPKKGERYYFSLEYRTLKESFTDKDVVYFGVVYFNKKEDMSKALDILGEDTIRTALSTYW